MHRLSRPRHASGVPGWGPAPGWGQPQLPGWAPLVDHGPLPLRAAGSLARWWWPILAVGGFLAIVAQVLDHDHPAPGLSRPSLLTIALAAAVVALLTLHRRYGPWPLARAVAEYATVALLTALLTASGIGVDRRPADQATSGQARAQAAASDSQPAVLRAMATVVRAGAKVIRAVAGAARWVVDLWHRADQQATTRGEAMATPPRSSPPSAPSSWRFPA